MAITVALSPEPSVLYKAKRVLLGYRTFFSDLGNRCSWLGWFAAANGLLALLIGLRYLPWIDIPDAATGLYVTLLYAAQFPLLALVAGLPLLIVGSLLPWTSLLGLLGVLYSSAGIILLITDTVVFAQYRFHLSGFIWEMAISNGTQTFAFPWQMWLMMSGIALAVVLVEALLVLLLAHLRPRARWLGILTAGVLLAQLSVHGWHAWADAHYNSQITSVTRAIPLYYATTAKRFLADHGLVDPAAVQRDNQASKLAGQSQGGQLDYPTSPLTCRPPEDKLNLLMIAIDGARWDMLDPRWMPNIYALSENSLTFTRHWSNGNATKPGIFTLFYSLPTSYWEAFTAAKQPPVLMSRMEELGYDFKILKSAPLLSPAFTKNVFANVESPRMTTPGDKPWDRDIQITDDWLAYLSRRAKRQDQKPFFGFLFYDSPHNHRVPDDYPVKFQPYWDPVNKMALDQDFNPELIKNNYKSTLHFVDNQVERVLEDLRKRGLMSETIVMITSDHGQEFNEHGKNYWGHGSNFGQWQLRIPMVIHWPGRGSDTIKHRTENFDVAPTLMGQALGCSQTDPSVYATGNGLFKKRKRNWSIAHSYMDYAVLLGEHRIVQYGSGRVRTVNDQLEPAPGFSPSPRTIRAVLNEMSRFYR